MANNYVQFSVMFKLANVAQVTRAIEIAAERPAGTLQEDDLGFSVEAEGNEIWIYAEESGNPDVVIEYAVRLGREFKLTGLWGFTYAETCSKMRTDEFGGGAAVVNLKTGKVDYVNAHGWLHNKMCGINRKYGAERL